MNLQPGTKLSHYEILAKIGAGGMGEVYRARDHKLGRDVAIKVLPEIFVEDPERTARFAREARVLASLNHPGIAILYGLEEFEEAPLLVMELVGGETLEVRLAQGPIPIRELLPLAIQIAEALESAHENGIVHRDLKPANIKLTPDGKAKLLDFGLAKAFEDDVNKPITTESETKLRDSTSEGTVLGTASYMSPEQARGKVVDKRTDIWAFGTVLYESLSGARTFKGDTATDVLVSIVEHEPDWAKLPAQTPRRLRGLLERCLRKDVSRRLRDIGDARLEIEDILTGRESPTPDGGPAPGGPSWMRVAVASLLVGAIAYALGGFTREEPIAAPVVRFSVDSQLPLVGGQAPSVAISPDGETLVIAALEDGRPGLHLRSIDRFEMTPLVGTEDASKVHFSPDGEWVVFFAGDRLEKTRVSGGGTVTIAEARRDAGLSFRLDDTIIFGAAERSGFQRISPEGGAAIDVTTPDLERGEQGHYAPDLLPDGRGLLVTVATGDRSRDARIDARVAVVDLTTGETRTIIEAASHARYVPTGHLAFVQSGRLMAAPFDLERRELAGSPRVIVEDLGGGSGVAAHYDFSASGTLVYAPGPPAPASTLVWVERSGEAMPVTNQRRAYSDPRISPDGELFAVTIASENNSDIWLYEEARDVLTRLTFDESLDDTPTWTADGERITYRSSITGAHDIFSQTTDASGEPTRLTTSNSFESPGDWAPDGSALLYSVQGNTGWDIWSFSRDGEGTAKPFLATPFNEYAGRFSPDGRFVAFVSNESGQREVYIARFPGPGGKVRISTAGGTQPVWAPDGRELFYRNAGALMSVKIDTELSMTVSRAETVFVDHYEDMDFSGYANYDIAPDGERFLMIEGASGARLSRIHIVVNWFRELERILPGG